MVNQQQYYNLVRRPVVTEKSSKQQGYQNQYTFEVAPDTNKVEVRKAIEALFGVKVLKVNMIIQPSKVRRSFGRPGRSRPWKKAVVTVRQGEIIEIA